MKKVSSSKAVVRVSTLADKLTKVQAKAISDTLAERLPNLDMEKSEVEA